LEESRVGRKLILFTFPSSPFWGTDVILLFEAVKAGLNLVETFDLILKAVLQLESRNQTLGKSRQAISADVIALGVESAHFRFELIGMLGHTTSPYPFWSLVTTGFRQKRRPPEPTKPKQSL
jgi:hypothetical protein